MEMGQGGNFFLDAFCQNFFDGDGTVRYFFLLSFVNMGMGAWRWDSVAIFSGCLCAITHNLSPLPPKKIIT